MADSAGPGEAQTILVLGDSLAEGYWQGLHRKLLGDPRFRDPRLVRPGGYDFRLEADSPAIGIGWTETPATTHFVGGPPRLE